MKSFIIYTRAIEVEIDLDIDVTLLDSRVFTTNDISKIAPSQKKVKSKKYLCISIEIQLEESESFFNCAAYARPRLLIILGILTFLTQELFDVFSKGDSYVTTTQGKLDEFDTKKFKFRFNKFNFLEDLELIIDFVNSEQEDDKLLFYSLVDRYRKAVYLEKESEDNFIYDDEVLLSHFHILELLSGKYHIAQKKLANQLINQFSEKMLKDIYQLEGDPLQSEQKSKIKLIESIFIKEFPVTSKINFMLKEQGILSDRLKSFISILVNDRNSVAHGRQAYQEHVIFPIPPFFPIIRNRIYTFKMLRIFTGRVISIFLHLDNLKEEWKDFENDLLPSIDEINEFINKEKYREITIGDFYAGKYNGIEPFTFSFYLLNKKLRVKKAIPALSNIILNCREDESEVLQLITAAVLIADFSTGKLRQKCIDIIILTSKKRWLILRDLLNDLKYLGHKPETLKDMILSKKIT